MIGAISVSLFAYLTELLAVSDAFVGPVQFVTLDKRIMMDSYYDR